LFEKEGMRFGRRERERERRREGERFLAIIEAAERETDNSYKPILKVFVLE